LSARLPSAVRELVELLTNDGAMPQEISPEVVVQARTAGVIEALAGRPRGRAAIGNAADDYFIAQVALGAMRLHEFRQIAVAMNHQRIPLVPLKGMAYALMLEKGGPTRAMADIDLLVPPDRFEAAGALMRELGYEEKTLGAIERSPGHHERSFGRNGRLVEIHRFFLRGRRVTVDYAALWTRAVPLVREDVPCRRLSPEDTFLYHCMHMGIHEFATQGLRAVWELRRLVLEDKPDLVVAAKRAREWGILRMTWCALRLLEECFPGTLSSVTHSKPHLRDSALRSRRAPSGLHDNEPQAIGLFQPALPVQFLLEEFILRPSLALLVSPGLLPRHVQIFRKGLLVDHISGAIAYLLWYARAVLAARH